MIGHFGDESFKQSTAFVLTTKNKDTKHYIHQQHKKNKRKAALAIANKTN